jgi:transposase InsO family protein
MGISPRTLRHWVQSRRQAGAPRARGRPPRCATRDERNQAYRWLRESGPGTSLAALRAAFPQLRRRDLLDLLRRYRHARARRAARYRGRLEWKQPGTVWAIDFKEPSEPLEGQYPAILAVRDLASRYQLLWEPVTAADGEVVRQQVAKLFVEHGPPLVFKSDNGSPFVAEETEEFVSAAQVAPLHSPPRRPSYNGGVERANGTLAQIQEAQAACHNRAGLPTCADAQAARRLANQRCYPQGYLGPTAEQLWSDRPAITAEQRRAFQAAIAAGRARIRQAWNLSPHEPLSRGQQATMDRRAIRDALLDAGLLTIHSRLRRLQPMPSLCGEDTMQAERGRVPPTVGDTPRAAIDVTAAPTTPTQEAHNSTHSDHR